MQTLTLAASTRTVTGKAVKHIRIAGRVPAVMYGFGMEPKNIEFDRRAFEKLFAAGGESTLVDVVIDNGAAVKALVQDVTHDPFSGYPTHVDLRTVNMSEKITAEVRLSWQGESLAEKALGAVITRVHEDVEVECLPSDLVSELVVDLSLLKNVGDAIRVRDLVVPPGITILADAEEALATCSAAMTEEEIKAMEQQPVGDVSAIEMVEKKKADDGDAAAPAADAKEAKKE